MTETLAGPDEQLFQAAAPALGLDRFQRLAETRCSSAATNMSISGSRKSASPPESPLQTLKNVCEG